MSKQERESLNKMKRKRNDSDEYQNSFTKLHIGSPRETKQQINRIVEQMDITGNGFVSYHIILMI